MEDDKWAIQLEGKDARVLMDRVEAILRRNRVGLNEEESQAFKGALLPIIIEKFTEVLSIHAPERSRGLSPEAVEVRQVAENSFRLADDARQKLIDFLTAKRLSPEKAGEVVDIIDGEIGTMMYKAAGLSPLTRGISLD